MSTKLREQKPFNNSASRLTSNWLYTANQTDNKVGPGSYPSNVKSNHFLQKLTTNFQNTSST